MALKLKKSIGKTGKKNAPASGKPFKPAKGSRFVLFIGDEGAILIHMDGPVVKSRQFVPGTNQEHLDELRATLATDLKAPVMMVVDSIDQTYVQHTLPPVSKLNVNKLIKNRLERDFGPDAIKGAVLLGREQTGRKDWNFLMISLEKSPHMMAWLDFAESLPNRFQGIYLVSVETENLVKNLERAMALPREEVAAQWKFFVSHNKVGGFRQVILRNNRIIFTRLAQPLTETNPEVVAGNIEQEISTTLEYVRRLSFKPEEGLDVYVIAAEGIKTAIDGSKFEARACHVMTPYEVATHLGIEGATQPTDQFGDVVLAASIGGSRHPVLTLSTQAIRQLDKYFQMLTLLRVVMLLGCVSIVAYAGYEAFSMYSYMQEIDTLTENKQKQLTSKAQLDEEIKNSHRDINKISDLIELYQIMHQEKLSAVPVIKRLQPLKALPATIKGINWSLATGPAASPNAPPPTMPDGSPVPAGKNKIIVIVTLEISAKDNDSVVLRDISKRVLQEYKNVFTGYEVAYINLPQELLEDSTMQVKFQNPSANQEAVPDKAIELQLTIKGDMPDKAPMSAQTSGGAAIPMYGVVP